MDKEQGYIIRGTWNMFNQERPVEIYESEQVKNVYTETSHGGLEVIWKHSLKAAAKEALKFTGNNKESIDLSKLSEEKQIFAEETIKQLINQPEVSQKKNIDLAFER